MSENASNFADDTSNLLLDCLRPAAPLHALETFGPDDWLALLQQAGRYFLGPLLYQRLIRERPAQSLVPSETEQTLQQVYYWTLKKNMLAYHLLGQVLARLQAAGVRVLLLKGAYLAEQVYGDIGLRPMGDLDLLVSPQDLQLSLDLLREMGFTSHRPYFAEADGALHFHAPAMIKDEVAIELHWNLVVPSSPVQIDIQGLWNRAQPITLEDGQAWALAPEDLLLYLCIHAAYGHQFREQLRSLVDIAEVIRHFRQILPWETMADTAARWGAGRGVYLCLVLVAELLGVDVLPSALLAALKPADWTPQTLDWARWHLLGGQEPEPNSKFLQVMNTDLSLKERFQALRRGLFPSRPEMAQRYGFSPDSWQITIRYPAHLASRIRLYFGHFLRRLRGDSRLEIEAHSTLALEEWLRIKNQLNP
jgi:hypothetical protein